MKRSWKQVADELLKLHVAGEIDLDAPRAKTPDELFRENATNQALAETVWRIQGFDGSGRERICAECGKRFWGPWKAYVLCSDECTRAQDARAGEALRYL